MAKKTFDCVEFQHRAGREFMRRLRAMTPEERAAFYIEENRKLREAIQAARAKREAEAVASQ